jgi:hypothetical protein
MFVSARSFVLSHGWLAANQLMRVELTVLLRPPVTVSSQSWDTVVTLWSSRIRESVGESMRVPEARAAGPSIEQGARILPRSRTILAGWLEP